MRNPFKVLADWLRKKPKHKTSHVDFPIDPVVDEALVRHLIPRAWFTKKGPGTEDRTRRVFRAFTPSQKFLAVDKGWIPAKWLSSNDHISYNRQRRR